MQLLCAASARSPPLPLFFFSASAHHLALHSFPTRRSSDLICGSIPCRRRRRWPFSRPPAFRRAPRPSWPGARRKRSEEHTSELQSHHDLVCRLLLEKKNEAGVVRTPAINRLPEIDRLKSIP